MYGTVERIRAYPKKGKIGKDLEEGRFIENSGLEGDFHADGGERQISLLLSGGREHIADPKPRTEGSPLADSEKKGLCFSRFSENITIKGLSSPALKPGVRLSAGDVVLEITGETKHCHEECELYGAGKRCSFAGLNLFAKVTKSGFVRVGERVDLLQE